MPMEIPACGGITKDKLRYIFVAYPDYQDEAAFLTNWATKNLGSKQLAIFYQNDDYGKLGQAGMAAALAKMSGKAKAVAAIPYEVTERALSAHALKLKESGADTMVMYADPTHAAIITKTNAKVGFQPTVVASFPLDRRFGFAQGFDVFEEVFDVAIPGGRWQGVPLDDGGAFYSLAENITARAMAQLDAAPGDRQLFWFHYFDPHSPYGDVAERRLTVPELFRIAEERPDEARRWIGRARRLYEADLARLDRSLRELFDRLDADAARFETHVVFTADHGESFGEDGSLGHGERVTKGQVHVPAFVVSPRLEPAVRRDVAGSADVAATLLALAGHDAGARERGPGRRPVAQEAATSPASGARSAGSSARWATRPRPGVVRRCRSGAPRRAGGRARMRRSRRGVGAARRARRRPARANLDHGLIDRHDRRRRRGDARHRAVRAVAGGERSGRHPEGPRRRNRDAAHDRLDPLGEHHPTVGHGGLGVHEDLVPRVQ